MHSSPSKNNSADEKHLFLIDGYSFVFRAYHSLPPLTDPEGTPVGAVYGFTNMLMKLKSRVRTNNGDYMLIVLDSGRKTFRNEIYPEYKANRPPAPEDLVPQFPLIKDAAEALNLPSLSSDGYEADDIIATYAKRAEKKGIKVTIVSSDKDLMQLVSENTEMYDSMKDKRIGIKEVKEKFGVEPDKVLDVLSLMGDSSDNIPGVPGIGPKTASELINNFGSLDETLERAEEVKQNKRRESLIEFAEQAKLSRELAKLCEEVPLDHDIEDFAVREDDIAKLSEFLNKHGFKSLASRINNKNGVIPPAPPEETAPKPVISNANKENILITNIKELESWLERVKPHGFLSLSTAGDIKSSLKALALSTGDSSCFMVLSGSKSPKQASLFDDNSDAPKDALETWAIVKALKETLTDPAILKIAHDAKEIQHELENIEITPLDDVMVMSYVLDGGKSKHAFEDVTDIALPDELKKSKEPLEEIGMEKLRDIYCSRIGNLENTAKFLRQRLFDEKMLSVYELIDRPLIPILKNMEEFGVKLDEKELKKLSDEFGKEIQNLEKEIHKIAGHEFNIASPKQLGEVLFDEMSIEGGKKSSKTGAFSTGAEVLEELSAKGHVIAEHILKHRALSKLKSTYTDALLKGESGDRVHSTFTMTVTTTGRLSSTNPNLQNIPVRTEEGKKIRKAFIADKGKKLISADYSQIELRLIAHIANVESLKSAFKEGKDIHAATASEVFGVPLDEMTPEIRRQAKAINFGIIYGQSAFGLANGLGIDRTSAKNYIDAYFEKYPGIKKYMDETKQIAREQGYVTTLFGRKCFAVGINDKNGARRQFAERAAINAPLQGTAADIIKKAMIAIDRKLHDSKMDAKMILQVHDELLFEVAEKDAQKIADMVKKEMENVITLSIPLTVEAQIGNHWGEIH